MRLSTLLAYLAPLSLALLTACGDKEAECEAEGDYACDGDVLMVCGEDLTLSEEQDCAADDMICHDVEADSHCMAEGAMDMRR